MDRRKNLLIGIAVAIVVVAGLSYATGVTKLLLSPFGASAEYKMSESATAPELASGEWINSQPLKLNDLRGRVVLIEFWTFGCINCRNTLPFVKGWHDRYREKGLTIIGVHSPSSMRKETSNTFAVRYLRSRSLIRWLPITTIEHGTLIRWKPGPPFFC